jgi:hypothetical protein
MEVAIQHIIQQKEVTVTAIIIIINTINIIAITNIIISRKEDTKLSITNQDMVMDHNVCIVMGLEQYCNVKLYVFKIKLKLNYFYRCSLCNSSGRIQCSHCSGGGRVKCFIELIVKFENHQDDFIKKSEEIPDESLRHCQAHVTFSEQNERVFQFSYLNKILNYNFKRFTRYPIIKNQ